MDTSGFRPDQIHVAQQSRRDKLRIQHAQNPNHHFQVLTNTMNHHQQPPLGTICYHPSQLISSEMNNLSEMSHQLEPHYKQASSIDNHFNHHPSGTVTRDPQSHNFSTWKTISSQPTNDHMNNYYWVASNSPISPTFVSESVSCSYSKTVNSNNNNNIPMPTLDIKPYLGPCHDQSHSHLYHNALQELVSTPGVRSIVPVSSEETRHVPNWVVNGGELLLLPAYVDHSSLKNPSDHQWNGDVSFSAANDNSNTQTLSLSLSSVPSSKVHTDQNVFGSDDNNGQDFRSPNLLTHRNPGPLGPFTGYATILRSSKFLRPAEILLEEVCCVGRPKDVEIRELRDEVLEEFRVSGEGVCDGDSSGSLCGYNGSNEKRSWMDSYRPENLHKKAKLLYMQDEVCKKYKQYQQQMQMVVTSFESVAGLSTATPYVSFALKMVSKHFRSLKNAVIDQLKSIRNSLGEESISSPSAGTSNVSMLKFFEQSFQKQKGALSDVGHLDGQHIWRPQRGLPQRAVSVLRAWLFDHFLHPYPTDADKHMLATQTGLTRNQVSNWFINARVRVWKPMVEEIHTLETKTLDSGKTTGNDAVDCDQANDNSQSLNRLKMIAMPHQQQVECSSGSPSQQHDHEHDDRWNIANAWNHEKRSRIEYPTSMMDGALMGFVPAPRGRVKMAGMGPVSLTLGLRQSAENGQRSHYGGQIIRDFVG